MASKKVIEQKKKVVSEIIDRIKNSSTVIFFNYHGLSATEITELRNKLNRIGSDIKVYKNTLTKRALSDLKIDLGNDLNGPNAIAFSNEIVEPIKILTDYAKGHETLQIKKGIIDGEISEREVLEKLATIPSREGLLTMLAGGMMGIVKDLSICLHLYSEKKSE